MISISIPSPSWEGWQLGPLEVRAYAICIITGIFVAVWLANKRWLARGGKAEQVADLALWVVPFGIIGARIYHVVTDWNTYFGPNAKPWEFLAIWHGGLGIIGGVIGGVIGGLIGLKWIKVKALPMLDVVAPGVLIAQGIGRWGNYFNKELFGKPTELPWALEIPPQGSEGQSLRPAGYEKFSTFHPAFLYECVWNLAGAGLLLWLDRKYKIGNGRLFALYVMVYSVGRFIIEQIRIDSVQFDYLGGFRFNAWAAIVLFTAALGYFIFSLRKHPGKESEVLVAEPAESNDLAKTA